MGDGGFDAEESATCKAIEVPNSDLEREPLATTRALPDDEGPAITIYVVQYKVEDPIWNWFQATVDGSVLKANVPRIRAPTSLVVQGPAVANKSDGSWRESGGAEILAALLPNTFSEFDEALSLLFRVMKTFRLERLQVSRYYVGFR